MQIEEGRLADYLDYIEANTLRVEASRRGGGIEVDVGALLNKPFAKMTAYQNYLGGGLLGRIENSYNFDRSTLTEKDAVMLAEFARVLNEYFHRITNEEAGEWDEWSATDFDALQARPVRAY